MDGQLPPGGLTSHPSPFAPRPSSKLVKVALEWCFLDYALFPLDPPNTQTPSSRLFPRALSLCASPFSWLFLHFQLSFGYGVWEQIEVDKQKSRKSYRQSTYENNNTQLWSRVVLEILDGTRSTVLCVWKNIIIFQVFACTFYITVECNYNAIIFIVLLEEIALQSLFYYFIFYTL